MGSRARTRRSQIQSTCGAGACARPRPLSSRLWRFIVQSEPASGTWPTAKTETQVKMGDAPADRVASFEVTVSPITATPIAPWLFSEN
jgi:hypothetical protein